MLEQVWEKMNYMKYQKIVVANWKANPPTLIEARKLFAAVKKAAGSFRGALVVCPPAPFLADLALSYRGSRIRFGAQDVFYEKGGSFTGEYSADMLRSVKTQYVILGHSERRRLGETNEDINKKIAAALAAGLTPILCVGEKGRDVEGNYFQTIEEQLKKGLSGISDSSLPKIIIAYEPVWAIGKRAEDAMKPNDVQEMAIFIRKTLAQKYPRNAVDKVAILYGGSAEPENVAGILTDGGVSGFLVGHVSLEPARFKEMLSVISDL